MATIVETQQSEAVQRFLLYDVDWESYEKMLEALGDRPGLKVTYDEGTLELMSPSRNHEWTKRRLGRLIEMLTFELDIPIQSGGSTTFRKREMRRGLEPDECYWIQNEPAVRGKQQLDLRRDPPPDLAIEMEISRSALDRPGIYASLRVPEIWRLVHGTIQVNLLQPDGTYGLSTTSRSFPFLPMGEFSRFLEIDETTDETTWLRRFVEWVRGQDFRP